MPGNYNRFNTVSAGDTITAANYNGEFDTIRTNFTPAGLDDASDSTTAFRQTFDPGESGSENLPSSLEEEIQAIRFLIKEITGKTYWYVAPTATTTSLCPVGTIIPFYDFNAAVSFDTNVFAYCNGATINSANSPINGLVLPDLSGRYLVGFGTDGGTDVGSATWNATAVGAASHQINIAHTHVFDHVHSVGSHTHGAGSLQFETATFNTTAINMFYANGTATTVITELSNATASGSSSFSSYVSATGSGTAYTNAGTGATASASGNTNTTAGNTGSSGSATQSIQPSSIRVRYIIRYI